MTDAGRRRLPWWMTGLMLAETLVALLVLAAFVALASAYPMPSGNPSPVGILLGSIPLVAVAGGWLACLAFMRRGHKGLAVAATIAPVAIFLLFLGAM